MFSLFIAAVAAQVVWAARDDYDLLFVQLVHRHGARTPIVSSNSSVLCPGAGGCGVLNDEGKAMLRQLGVTLRQRYQNLTNGRWFSSDNYDPDAVYSRSTDVQRTLQSSAAFLWGLYPNATGYYPAIDTVDLGRDELLVVNSIPSFQVPYEWFLPTLYEAQVRAFVLSRLTVETLARMGVELSLVDLCASSVAVCALELQDVAASFQAVGTLGRYPTVSKNFGVLSDVRKYFNGLLFPFNASHPTDAARGSLGFGLASLMVQRFDAYPMGPWVLMEYSAHDTTVMPFCTALGVNDAMLPLFGQVYIVELLRRKSDGNWMARVLQGAPIQTPGTHDYTLTPLPIQCMDGDGQAYVAADGVCPYTDFRAFVLSTAPQSPAGNCYVSEAVKEQIGCHNPAPPSTDECQMFRTLCPAYACPAGYHLNFADLSCTTSNAPRNAPEAPEAPEAPRIAVACAGCVIGGAALGAIAMWAMRTRERLPKEI